MRQKVVIKENLDCLKAISFRLIYFPLRYSMWVLIGLLNGVVSNDGLSWGGCLLRMFLQCMHYTILNKNF